MAIVGILAVATWLLLGAGDGGADTATVLGLPTAIVSALLTLWFGVAALRQAGRVGQSELFGREALRLAVAVRAREEAALASLLADTADVQSVDVRFSLSDLPLSRTDGGEPTGRSSEIAEYFRSLRRGRLVVLGAAGSGKTVLAIRLVRDLAVEAQRTVPQIQGAFEAVPVPIRVSAPAFGARIGGRELDQMTASQLAHRLDVWLAEHVALTYGVPEAVAAGMVTGGWFIPVLDGVDEMDLHEASPRRAAALVAALNQPTGTGVRPVVLTCRTELYQRLASASPAYGGDSGILQDATAVQVQPMSAAAVNEYLALRFPDPAGTACGEPRLRPLLDRLAADQPGDPVLSTLRSPLRLFLAVVACRSRDSDPAALIRHAEISDLDDRLYAELIPALSASRPDTHGERYQSRQVTTWLTALAGHLRAEELAGRSGTDLRLDTVWLAAGDRAPRYGTAVIFTAAAATAVYFWVRDLVSVGLPRDAYVAVGVAASVALVVLVAMGSLRRETVPHRLDVRQLLTRAGRRRFGAWFALGVATGLIYGCVVGLAGGYAGGQIAEVATGLAFGLVGGVVFGTSLGFAFGLSARPDAIYTPGQLVSEGVAHSAARLSVGLAVGLTLGLAGGLAHGLVFGVLLGLVAVSTTPWPRFGLACLILARRGDSPFRLARFLDWTYEAGLMRLAGSAVQFRHRDFQAWLLTDRVSPR